MAPIQSIDFGDPLTDADRSALFHEYEHGSIFNAVLQYLRDEAYAALDASVKAKLEGNESASTMALGGFDRLSQVIVKMKAASEIAPPVEE